MPVSLFHRKPAPKRVAGKLGRIRGRSAPVDYLPLSDYLADPLPLHPAADDFTSGRTDWGMFGNDTLGDCGFAGRYHYDMANAWTAKEAALPQDAAVQNAVAQAYLDYNHGQDVGVDLASVLQFWLTHDLAGLPTIGGFAQVSLGGSEFASALHVFGGLYTGVLISNEAMQEFQNGEAWSSTATDWAGGHCVPVLARNTRYGEAITWGAVQRFTWEWWQACREEAWVIFTPEQMKAPKGIFNGVNVKQLAKDIKALHGVTAA